MGPENFYFEHAANLPLYYLVMCVMTIVAIMIQGGLVLTKALVIFFCLQRDKVYPIYRVLLIVSWVFIGIVMGIGSIYGQQ